MKFFWCGALLVLILTCCGDCGASEVQGTVDPVPIEEVTSVSDSTEEATSAETTATEDAEREKHLVLYREIVPAFEEVIREIPSTSLAGNLSIKGTDALRMGNLEEARKLFDEAEKSSPGEPLTKLGTGWLSFCEGRGDTAISKFAELMDARMVMGEEDVFFRLALSSVTAVQQAQ